MNDIPANLESVRCRIAAAAAAVGRPPDDITLLAVSKAQPPAAVRAAHAAGQSDFGENYLKEAAEKMVTAPGVRWHYIGRIQSNKTREIAQRFDWVHTIDRLRTARRLSNHRLSCQRPGHLPPIQACIQVNISGERAKAGVEPGGCEALADAVTGLDGITLRGLMALPAPSDDVDEQRRAFAGIRRLLERLNDAGHSLDTLSMGMSADLEAAVMEGATIVRVGTAIFGPRG